MTAGAGPLRHKFTIQAPLGTLDSRGQRSGGFSDVATIRGSFQLLSGRELELAHQLFSGAAGQVVIRYYPGLTTRHRLKFGSRLLHIGHIEDPEERHVWLRILVSEQR